MVRTSPVLVDAGWRGLESAFTTLLSSAHKDI